MSGEQKFTTRDIAFAQIDATADAVARGSMDVLRDRYRAKRRVLDGRAGRECAAARGNLNDAVGCALGKSAQNGIGGSE